jgi:hypothetical protein
VATDKQHTLARNFTEGQEIKSRIMARYSAEEQAKTRLSLGKSIAQFLSCQQQVDYTIVRWLPTNKVGDYQAYSI